MSNKFKVKSTVSLIYVRLYYGLHISKMLIGMARVSEGSQFYHTSHPHVYPEVE